MPGLNRWAFFLTVAVGLPTVLTFFSLLHTHPEGKYGSEDQPKSGIGAFLSFHTPSSLFPPSAIISLTDDNSTFFLARPADFGPKLLSNGLSGQLWIGSGFGEDHLGHNGAGAGTEGELGCSDVPGWDEKYTVANNNDADSVQGDGDKTNTGSSAAVDTAPRVPRPANGDAKPSEMDGTDDHLHHPLPSSPVTKPVNPSDSTHHEIVNTGHADIQSLQESAEIAGKVALLSRGGCGFLEKVKWAQRRGATALIVGDHTRGGALVTMYARGDTSNVTIPSVFTSHTTAHLLSSLMPPEDDRDEAFVGGKGSGGSTAVAQKGTAVARGSKTTYSSRIRKRPVASIDRFKPKAKSGWMSSVKSVLLPDKQTKDGADTRRPPSSGRLDVAEKQKNENGFGTKASVGTHTVAKSTPTKREAPKSGLHQNDDFVIGVQDWRDPDLIVAKASNTKSTTTSTTDGPVATEILRSNGKDTASEQKINAALTGGSITPGSGEYSKPGEKDHGKATKSDKDTKVSSSTNSDKGLINAQDEGVPAEEHEGLWVTITLTTMSTSPFFDTLLVLVVSPLVTLTVVYALLLLRSRIRRRRWRAPKSVVERLPIRTYHTMSTSSTASSTRYASPQGSSPTSPLLQSSPRSVNNQARPRSATTSGVSGSVSASLEKACAKASLTQSSKKPKKFHARHVECVVCLEEYVDGKSRVMSLPCGHEFHAECITPWLTTRRRTCPICKGDVVRSLAHPQSNSDQSSQGTQDEGEIQTQAAETMNALPTAAIPIPRDAADLEQGDDLAATLVNEEEIESSSSRSPWAGLTSMSLGAFSGRATTRKGENDRNR